jgi:hypothetical protein
MTEVPTKAFLQASSEIVIKKTLVEYSLPKMSDLVGIRETSSECFEKLQDMQDEASQSCMLTSFDSCCPLQIAADSSNKELYHEAVSAGCLPLDIARKCAQFSVPNYQSKLTLVDIFAPPFSRISKSIWSDVSLTESGQKLTTVGQILGIDIQDSLSGDLVDFYRPGGARSLLLEELQQFQNIGYQLLSGKYLRRLMRRAITKLIRAFRKFLLVCTRLFQILLGSTALTTGAYLGSQALMSPQLIEKLQPITELLTVFTGLFEKLDAMASSRLVTTMWAGMTSLMKAASVSIAKASSLMPIMHTYLSQVAPGLVTAISNQLVFLKLMLSTTPFGLAAAATSAGAATAGVAAALIDRRRKIEQLRPIFADALIEFQNNIDRSGEAIRQRMAAYQYLQSAQKHIQRLVLGRLVNKRGRESDLFKQELKYAKSHKPNLKKCGSTFTLQDDGTLVAQNAVDVYDHLQKFKSARRDVLMTRIIDMCGTSLTHSTDDPDMIYADSANQEAMSLRLRSFGVDPAMRTDFGKAFNEHDLVDIVNMELKIDSILAQTPLTVDQRRLCIANGHFRNHGIFVLTHADLAEEDIQSNIRFEISCLGMQPDQVLGMLTSASPTKGMFSVLHSGFKKVTGRKRHEEKHALKDTLNDSVFHVNETGFNFIMQHDDNNPHPLVQLLFHATLNDTFTPRDLIDRIKNDKNLYTNPDRNPHFGKTYYERLLSKVHPFLHSKYVDVGYAHHDDHDDHGHYDHGHGHYDDGHGHYDHGHGHYDDGHGHYDAGHGHYDDGHRSNHVFEQFKEEEYHENPHGVSHPHHPDHNPHGVSHPHHPDHMSHHDQKVYHDRAYKPSHHLNRALEFDTRPGDIVLVDAFLTKQGRMLYSELGKDFEEHGFRMSEKDILMLDALHQVAHGQLDINISRLGVYTYLFSVHLISAEQVEHFD